MEWKDAVGNYYDRKGMKMVTVLNMIDDRIISKRKYIVDIERDICELESLKHELANKIKTNIEEDKEWKK